MEKIANDKEVNSITQIIGIVLILLGMLSFISYFIVRIYAIYREGEAEFYGVALFTPDRMLLVIAISSMMIFLGVLLNIFSLKRKQEKKDEIDKIVDDLEKQIIDNNDRKLF